MECSIIIPVWNQLESTRACVDSVFRNTDSGYRLIIIDNASQDETRRYLEGLAALKDSPVTVIRNEENTGFVKAANQGMRISEGPYVCILNNDTLVTGHWLREMIGILSGSPDIGIVNPSSNNLGQRPAAGGSIDDYASRLYSEERGRFAELGSAIGFCMLIKRTLIEKIGLFDEAYGPGTFEDTDFSRRAVREGFRCVRACGAYVYHKEGGSFGRSREYDSNFARNRALYESRWGRPKRVLYRASKRDLVLSGNSVARMLKLAREGNWVYIYLRESADVKDIPAHSNIVVKKFPDSFFGVRTAMKMLTKKKRFDEIYEV